MTELEARAQMGAFDEVRSGVYTVVDAWLSAGSTDLSLLYEDLRQAGVLRNLEAEHRLRQDSAAAALREAAYEMPDDLAYPTAWLTARAEAIEGQYEGG